MDPPFRDGNYQQLTQTIIDNQWLKRGGLIYIESGNSLEWNKRFSELTVLKQKQAGNVHFALLSMSNER
jgi:16S rRNA G966 N2-methylase RsmD